MNDFVNSVLVIMEQFFLPQNFIYELMYEEYGFNEEAFLGLAGVVLTATAVGIGIDYSDRLNHSVLGNSPYALLAVLCSLFFLCGINAPIFLLIFFVILKLLFAFGIIRMGRWAILQPQWFALAVAVAFILSYILMLLDSFSYLMSVAVMGWSSVQVMTIISKDFRYEGIWGLIPLFLLIILSGIIPVRNLDLGLASAGAWYGAFWEPLAAFVDGASRLSFPISLLIGVGIGISIRTR